MEGARYELVAAALEKTPAQACTCGRLSSAAGIKLAGPFALSPTKNKDNKQTYLREKPLVNTQEHPK